MDIIQLQDKQDGWRIHRFNSPEELRKALAEHDITIGHGVEAQSNFAVTHGQAVAIGMAIVARASHCQDAGRILQILAQFGLPLKTDYSAKELFTCALSDKKRSGGTVSLILPFSIGNCRIVPTPVENLLYFIEEGL